MARRVFIPFDYSEHAKNTAGYAFGLAKEYGFELIFFHAFQLPVITAESSFINYPIEEMIKENKSALEKEAFRLSELNSAKEIKLKTIVKAGFTTETIIQESQEENADIILMSVTGRNKFGETMIGSNAIFTARNSKIPVLIIPEKYIFKKINKLTLAIDTNDEIEKKFSDKIKYWKDIFDADLEIINIYKKTSNREILQTIGELNAENEFSHIQHKTFYVNDEVRHGIHDFLSKSKPEIFVLVPKKHNIIADVFRESLTKHFAYHSEIPILCITK